MSLLNFLVVRVIGPLLFVTFNIPATAIADTITEELSTEQISQLNEGEVLLLEKSSNGKHGQTHTAYVLIPADISEVYKVLTNFAEYKQFMPNVKNIDILMQDKKNAILAYHLSLPAGIDKQYKLSLDYTIDGTSAFMSWKKLPWPGLASVDTITATEGYWKLSNYKNQVLVKYRIYTDPGKVPFGLGWIVDYMSRNSIVDVLANTRERVIDIRNKTSVTR